MVTYDEANHAYTVDGRRVPSVTEIAGILTAGKYGDMNQAMLEQAKRRGTAVHELCEAIDCGIDPEDLDIPPELVGYVNAYLAFLRDWRPEWDYIEKMVYTQSYAGRADRIGNIEGKPCIVDIKTTANMDRLSRISLIVQLFGYHYALCYMNLKWTRVEPMLLGVQLKKDGRYTVHDYEKIIEKDIPPKEQAITYLWDALLKTANVIGGYV